MLLNVVLTGRHPTTHELRSAGRAVGWLRPGLIGFGGFSDRAQVRAASRLAVNALEAWHVTRREPLGNHGSAALTTATRDEDLLRVREIIVGRLVVSETSGPAAGRTHGFELFVPPTTWLAVMLQFAQRIHTALSELPQCTEARTDAPGATPPVSMIVAAV